MSPPGDVDRAAVTAEARTRASAEEDAMTALDRMFDARAAWRGAA